VGEVEAEGGANEQVVAVAGGDVTLKVAVAEVEVDEDVVAELVGKQSRGNEELCAYALSYSVVEFLFVVAVVEEDVVSPV